jgi:hypothetical protein
MRSALRNALSDPTEEQIRVRAHRLWEIAGRSEVREQEVWYEAERELKGEAVQQLMLTEGPTRFLSD